MLIVINIWFPYCNRKEVAADAGRLADRRLGLQRWWQTDGQRKSFGIKRL